MVDFIIDEEFRSRNRKPTKQERNGLSRRIEAEGCKSDALTVAIIGESKILCDGHTTLEVCKELGVKTTEPRCIVFKDRESVLDWIDDQARGRRNLTPEEMAENRAERIKRVAEARQEGKSQRQIAEAEGVSQTQVKKDIEDATEQGCSVEPKTGKIVGKDKKPRKPRTAKPPKSSNERTAGIDRFAKRGLVVAPGKTPSPDAVPCPTCRGSGEVSAKQLARLKFTPPTLAEVTAYIDSRKGVAKKKVDPQRWMDHYTSNGWKVGKSKMADWQAAVRNWEGTNFGGSNNGRVSRVEAPPGKYDNIGTTIRG